MTLLTSSTFFYLQSFIFNSISTKAFSLKLVTCHSLTINFRTHFKLSFQFLLYKSIYYFSTLKFYYDFTHAITFLLSSISHFHLTIVNGLARRALLIVPLASGYFEKKAARATSKKFRRVTSVNYKHYFRPYLGTPGYYFHKQQRFSGMTG